MIVSSIIAHFKQCSVSQIDIQVKNRTPRTLPYFGNNRYSVNADIWAVGVIAFELAHYTHPFAGNGSQSYIEIMQTVLERGLPGNYLR